MGRAGEGWEYENMGNAGEALLNVKEANTGLLKRWHMKMNEW